jgi:hypothetical protein
MRQAHELTDDELDIAIAESQGWQRISKIKCSQVWVGCNPDKTYRIGQTKDHIPNYTGDLNAIHEVVRSLNNEEHAYFRDNLRIVSAPDDPMDIFRVYVDATARQLSEAFYNTEIYKP